MIDFAAARGPAVANLTKRNAPAQILFNLVEHGQD
jgi:hypothetical protein